MILNLSRGCRERTTFLWQKILTFRGFLRILTFQSFGEGERGWRERGGAGVHKKLTPPSKKGTFRGCQRGPLTAGLLGVLILRKWQNSTEMAGRGGIDEETGQAVSHWSALLGQIPHWRRPGRGNFGGGGGNLEGGLLTKLCCGALEGESSVCMLFN